MPLSKRDPANLFDMLEALKGPTFPKNKTFEDFLRMTCCKLRWNEI